MSRRSARLTRTSAAALFVCAAALIAWRIVSPAKTYPPKQRLLADDGGAIQHVVCVANSARRAVLRNAAALNRIVNALPGRIRVTLLTNDRSAFTFAHDPDPQRVPFLLWLAATSQPATAPAEPKPGYPVLTYNNVLMETLSGKRMVYLPQYGWEAMDIAAAEAWRRFGFEPVPIGELTISAM